MNLDALKTLTFGHAPDVQRRPGCPDEYAIASFMDGGLAEQEHRQLELHIADCEYCLALVGLLGRAIDNEPETAVPDLLVARSAKMAETAKRTGRAQTAGHMQVLRRWGMAAVIVLACGVFIAFDSREQSGLQMGSPVESKPAYRQARNIDPVAMGPKLAVPAEDSTIDPVTQAFAWSPVQDSLYYQVRIVNDVGDLLWQERTNATRWKLPSQLELMDGNEYFVRIDAFLSQSRSLSSDYVAFKVLQQD